VGKPALSRNFVHLRASEFSYLQLPALSSGEVATSQIRVITRQLVVVVKASEDRN
jgi:hypothetical protein